MRFLSIIVSVLTITGCHQSQVAVGHDAEDIAGRSDFVQYAEGFTVEYHGALKKVEVLEPYKGASSGITYWLVPKGVSVPDSLTSEKVIKIPLKSLVCTSTTHITPLDLLGESHRLTGFPSTQYVSSDRIRKQVKAGDTKDVGRDNNLNVELILDLKPEALMTYSLTGDYSKLSIYKSSGIPIIENAEYLEKTPLGRAEWIKFIALFFNKEQQADSIFEAIASDYHHTLSLIEVEANMPSVFSGVVYGDTWYMPGGNSWAGKFFNDAKADYLWKESAESGSIELSFEAVFEKSYQADYWIGAAHYSSKKELSDADNRYMAFKAFKNDKVFTYNARQNPEGGNDYFESGFSRPDIVLRDLVRIIHPTLLPDHKLYYYKKLD